MNKYAKWTNEKIYSSTKGAMPEDFFGGLTGDIVGEIAGVPVGVAVGIPLG